MASHGIWQAASISGTSPNWLSVLRFHLQSLALPPCNLFYTPLQLVSQQSVAVVAEAEAEAAVVARLGHCGYPLCSTMRAFAFRLDSSAIWAAVSLWHWRLCRCRFLFFSWFLFFLFDWCKPKKSKLAATRDSADIDESGEWGRRVGGGGIKQNPWQKLLFVLRFALRSLQILIKCIIRIYYSNVCWFMQSSSAVSLLCLPLSLVFINTN